MTLDEISYSMICACTFCFADHTLDGKILNQYNLDGVSTVFPEIGVTSYIYSFILFLSNPDAKKG